MLKFQVSFAYLCPMKSETNEKSSLHPRNPHRFRYDFIRLTEAFPGLAQFVTKNLHHPETDTIDFSNPNAVKALNKAILISEYGVQNWDIPNGYLCPPIPGRADSIHCIADLLALSNGGEIPTGDTVCGLDIGVGSNCIYPIIGNSSYGWSFVATDTDAKALNNCVKILEANPKLHAAVSLQQQPNPRFIFKDIVRTDDRFAFTVCNPPFHSSREEAEKGSLRKTRNLNDRKMGKSVLNFGGQSHELWCNGGEIAFVTQMINESAKYPTQCLWFTTLVSKAANLKPIYKILAKAKAVQVETIDMAQGQKTSRIVAWTFQSESQRKSWKF